VDNSEDGFEIVGDAADILMGVGIMHDDEKFSGPLADNEVERRVAELDFGESPDDMLVVREVIWSRLVGIVLALFLGLPLCWVAWILAAHAELLAAMIFATIAIGPLGVCAWLFYQVLNRTSYYVAMDGTRYYRRWGPRRLEIFPLQDLGPFSERLGVLIVELRPAKKKLVVIKHSYSPERIATLVSRLNAWRTTPRELRKRMMDYVNVFEARDSRAAANRQIMNGLKFVCLYPLLIVASVKFGLFGKATIVLWVLITLAALLHLIGGIIKRLAVPALRPAGDNPHSDHPSSSPHDTDL